MSGQTVTSELVDFDLALAMAEKAEAYHKKAFRAGYDMLKAYYPPRWDTEYWTTLWKEICGTIEHNRDNPFMTNMLNMVADYLDEVCKTLPNPYIEGGGV